MRGYRVKRKSMRPHGVKTERPASLSWGWDADGREDPPEEQREDIREEQCEEQLDEHE